MIVNRRTFLVKKGCWEEALTVSEANMKRISFPHASRCYASNISPFSRVVLEAEFENLAEYEAFWAELFGSPEGVAIDEEWGALTETGGTNEIWWLL